jgi:parallel beta-helix repeat protein
MRLPYILILLSLSFGAFAAELSGPLSGRLAVDKSPYLVHKDIRVEPGDTLIVDAGVTMQFDSTVVFTVEGCLLANGTSERPIVFTASNPLRLKPEWEGIEFSNRSKDGSTLTHCVVEFARRGMMVFSSSPAIANCTIRYCAGDGIMLKVSQSRLLHNTVQENGKAGIHATAFRGIISGNTILENHGDGLVLVKSAGLVEKNRVLRNGDDGIFARLSSDRIQENRLIQNKDDGILVEGGNPEIFNNLINRSTFGIFGYKGAKPLLVNNTLTGHLYGLFARGGTLIKLENSILWQNQTPVMADSVSRVVVQYCNVEGGYPGNGNLDRDPRFADEIEYPLTSDSPCLNRGNPEPLIHEEHPAVRHIGASLK